MYKLLTDKGQLFALILGMGCVAIFFASVFSGLSNAGYSTSDDLNAIMKNNPGADFSFFDIGLYIIGALVIAAVAIALVYGLMQIISSPKSSMKGIIGVVVIAAISFIAYSTSDSDFASSISDTLQKNDVTENVSKMISGGMKASGILGGLAVLLLVAFEIRNLFK